MTGRFGGSVSDRAQVRITNSHFTMQQFQISVRAWSGVTVLFHLSIGSLHPFRLALVLVHHRDNEDTAWDSGTKLCRNDTQLHSIQSLSTITQRKLLEFPLLSGWYKET